MATTLNLIETTQIDTRRNGDVAWVRCILILDGVETGAEFRARVGEEPIVIDGDTITVADDLVERLRSNRASAAAEAAKRADRDAAAITTARAALEDFIATKGFDGEIAARLLAHFDAAGIAVTFPRNNREYQAYAAGVRTIAGI